MEKFARERFKTTPEQRRILCGELGAVLQERLRQNPRFHQEVYALISELQAVGHDLASFDESDEMQAWAPDYTKSGRGLVLTFTAPDEVEVKWRDQ